MSGVLFDAEVEETVRIVTDTIWRSKCDQEIGMQYIIIVITALSGIFSNTAIFLK